MADITSHETGSIDVRSLEKNDLAAVVAIDRRIGGKSRRGYFERRLAAALRDPKGHLQIAAVGPSGLVGFVLARIAFGEFGRPAPAILLESIGVDPSAQHAGMGRRMMAALEKKADARGIATIATEADWRAHGMLAFLDGAGFVLSPRTLLERKVVRVALPESEQAIERLPSRIRPLRAGDFEAVVRIDKLVGRRDRSEYFRGKFDEALRESGIAVSLVREDDGFVVAFAIARVDVGDFGHVEQTASLDTIGVHPSFARKGIGRELLDETFENLAALHVDRLETEVAFDELDLLGFFRRLGFAPSQRLVFEKTRTAGAA